MRRTWYKSHPSQTRPGGDEETDAQMGEEPGSRGKGAREEILSPGKTTSQQRIGLLWQLSSSKSIESAPKEKTPRCHLHGFPGDGGLE